MTHPVLPPLVIQKPLHHLLCKALHAGAVGDRGHEAHAALADLEVEVWGVGWQGSLVRILEKLWTGKAFGLMAAARRITAISDPLHQ